MEQRVSVVTLGVGDKEKSRAFYEGMGWKGVGGEGDDPVFFQAGGLVIGLWDRAALAEDSCMEDNGGWGGITLAHNVASPADVDAAVEVARAAGGTVAREPAKTFWGGYNAVVLDPDGHPWEICHNPHWTLTADGEARLGT